jgi:protein-tyrosine phosphatase
MAIVPCPPGGEQLAASVRSLREQGIETMVSLLRADEARVLRLEAEGRLCREAGIDYKWLPVQDHSIPESMEEFRLVVDQLHRDLRAGKGVGAHCYAGIGRSCMLMACLLCVEGLQPDEAFARLSAARGLRVPDTWLQILWVEHFAESLAAGG